MITTENNYWLTNNTEKMELEKLVLYGRTNFGLFISLLNKIFKSYYQCFGSGFKEILDPESGSRVFKRILHVISPQKIVKTLNLKIYLIMHNPVDFIKLRVHRYRDRKKLFSKS